MCSAFCNVRTLVREYHVAMDIRVTEVVQDGPLRDVVYDWVSHCVSNGDFDELVLQTFQLRPGNSKVRAFYLYWCPNMAAGPGTDPSEVAVSRKEWDSLCRQHQRMHGWFRLHRDFERIAGTLVDVREALAPAAAGQTDRVLQSRQLAALEELWMNEGSRLIVDRTDKSRRGPTERVFFSHRDIDQCQSRLRMHKREFDLALSRLVHPDDLRTELDSLGRILSGLERVCSLLLNQSGEALDGAAGLFQRQILAKAEPGSDRELERLQRAIAEDTVFQGLLL